jgi:hypothetical protein
VTIFLDDLDAHVAAIAARGLEPDERETYDNGVRKVCTASPTAMSSGSAARRSTSLHRSDERNHSEKIHQSLTNQNRCMVAEAMADQTPRNLWKRSSARTTGSA